MAQSHFNFLSASGKEGQKIFEGQITALCVCVSVYRHKNQEKANVVQVKTEKREGAQ